MTIGARNELDSPPARDVLEVTVLGRGVGEAVVVHLGDGRWIAVDSTLEGEHPVTLLYLERIGVAAAAVELIVASHWDSDHVRGLAAMVRACPNAAFACSAAMQDRRFIKVLLGTGDRHARESEARNSDQFAGIVSALVERGRDVTWAQTGTVVWEASDARVWSLSPSSATQTRSLVKLVEQTPRGADPPLDRQNHLSVVLWIEVGEHRILLAGDLEKETAWSAVVASAGRRDDRAAVIKVAHHGSKNGHSEAAWDQMLHPQPLAVLTPFNRRHLPTDEDRQRIRGRTERAYLAGADARSPERDGERERLIAAGTASRGLRPGSGPLGHVRLRADLAAGRSATEAWTESWWGSAGPL